MRVSGRIGFVGRGWLAGLWCCLAAASCSSEEVTGQTSRIALAFEPSLVSVEAGEQLSVRLVAQLERGAPIEGLVLRGELAPGTELVSALRGELLAEEQTLRWSVGPLEPGQIWEDTLVMRVAEVGTQPRVMWVKVEGASSGVEGESAPLVFVPRGGEGVDAGMPTPDGGQDAGADAGADSGTPVPDAGMDAGMDAGVDAGQEYLGSGERWLIGRTDTSYLDLEVTRVDGGWLLNDRASFELRPGHLYWYHVNGVVLKTAEPLRDYLHRAGGVLDVRKAHYKDWITSEYQWAPVDDGYFVSDASYTFGPRADVGGQSVWMLDTKDRPAGLRWLDNVPDWYRGEHTMSWALRAPPMQLEAGKSFMFTPEHIGFSVEQRRSRGESFTPGNPQLEGQLGMVLNTNDVGIDSAAGDRDYYRAKAEGVPLTGARAFQLNEGQVWLPHMSSQVGWFIERIHERLQAAGRTDYVLMADYGGYDFAQGHQWVEHDQRWRYTVSTEELLARDPYLAWSQRIVNAVNVKHYGTHPQDSAAILIRIGELESIRRAGLKPLLFGWGQMEVLGPTGYVAGFGWQTEKPSGGVVIKSHLPVVPYDEAVAHGFIALWWGDGFWVWDGRTPRNPDPETIDYSWDPSQTTLLGGAQITPVEGSGYAEMPDTGFDGYYVGAYLYHQARATAGGERRYVSFSVDGQRHQAEPDGSEVVTAIRDHRGICQVRSKGSQVTIVYYNPYAENTWSDLEVELDGDRLHGRVFGRRIHVANVTR